MNRESFKDHVLDQLRGIQPECRGMFGGFGLYANRKFFGIIFKGRLYFKTTEQTRAAYLERGMKHFRPNDRQQLFSYLEVPADILEETDTLTRWANEAIQSANDIT